ncbi:hypothetical protein A0H81_01891 [Grifola frondosa]|uniref:Uncharacterized protein n=1 Tax=Grifola frondosa TaxID=5627 RepID=A0A1C7MLB6_GRIFR|nr:hypothetical protein A0H81_01891 [Grifola frondosa]
MQGIKPPYPSFALVMSTAGYYPPYSSRLPPYRSGHAERYHPYPRVSRPLDDRLMNTVDYRYVGEPTWELSPSALHLRPVVYYEAAPDVDVSTLQLDGMHPAVSVEDNADAKHCSKLVGVSLRCFSCCDASIARSRKGKAMSRKTHLDKFQYSREAHPDYVVDTPSIKLVKCSTRVSAKRPLTNMGFARKYTA